jgi:quercetin dioxygenase-like cupin family protein
MRLALEPRRLDVSTGRAVLVTVGLVLALSTQASGDEDGLPHAFDAGWKGTAVCEVLHEDETVRVGRCRFPPGVGHDRHFHNPHFGYVLTGGTMRIEGPDGVETVETRAGASWSSDEVTVHEVLNVGATTASYLIVEPKAPAPAKTGQSLPAQSPVATVSQRIGYADGRDQGVHWNSFQAATDVFAGPAGNGLLLLWAADELDHPPSRELAARAGRWLIEIAEEAPGGLSWPVSKGGPRVMPNFSHGTAGIAYFLAALYQATGERDFLDAAVARPRRTAASPGSRPSTASSPRTSRPRSATCRAQPASPSLFSTSTRRSGGSRSGGWRSSTTPGESQ